MKNIFAVGILATLLAWSPGAAQAFFGGCCGNSCDSCSYSCDPCPAPVNDCCNDCCCDWVRTEICDSWYGKVLGGAVWYHDSDNTLSDGSREDYEYDLGWAVIGSLGYRWNCGLALEGEVGYHTADIDHVVSGGSSFDADGDVSILTFMANAYYYFCLCNRWNPYLGVGIGYAHVDIENRTASTELVDDSDGVFAYQFMAGIAYAWSCNFDLNLEYRYLGTADPDVVGATPLGIESDINTHFLGVGLTWHFN